MSLIVIATGRLNNLTLLMIISINHFMIILHISQTATHIIIFLPHLIKKCIFLPANQVSGCDFPVDDHSKCEEIRTIFNNSLRFDPSEKLMAYTIRDPVNNGTLTTLIILFLIMLKIIKVKLCFKLSGIKSKWIPLILLIILFFKTSILQCISWHEIKGKL